MREWIVRVSKWVMVVGFAMTIIDLCVFSSWFVGLGPRMTSSAAALFAFGGLISMLTGAAVSSVLADVKPKKER